MPGEMTVTEARNEMRCRICKEKVTPCGSPEGWQFMFREMIYPMAFTLNFGKKFAHTKCLTDKNTSPTLSGAEPSVE